MIVSATDLEVPAGEMVLASSIPFLQEMGWRGRRKRVPESVSPHPQSLPRGWPEEEEALARPWGHSAEIGRREWRGRPLRRRRLGLLGDARAQQALPG